MKDNQHIDIHKLPKKDPFKAPDGYFDTLSDRIMDRVESESEKDEPEEEKDNVRKLHINWKVFGYATAASLVLLAAFFVAYLSDNRSGGSAENLLAEVDTEDLILYLQQSELETEDLLEVADINDWDLMDLNPEMMIGKELNDSELDLLYENYGVSEDENLQMF